MVCAAMLPFVLLAWLVRSGKSGLALSLMSIIGAVFVVLIYASGRPFGVDPLRAMSTAMLIFLPALLGGGAGALLGWMLRRRDDQRLK
jgi:uncharacterized membrane protein YsdA (DUF1294 family)